MKARGCVVAQTGRHAMSAKLCDTRVYKCCSTYRAVALLHQVVAVTSGSSKQKEHSEIVS